MYIVLLFVLLTLSFPIWDCYLPPSTTWSHKCWSFGLEICTICFKFSILQHKSCRRKIKYRMLSWLFPPTMISMFEKKKLLSCFILFLCFYYIIMSRYIVLNIKNVMWQIFKANQWTILTTKHYYLSSTNILQSYTRVLEILFMRQNVSSITLSIIDY